MTLRLADRTALVTGASSGIGRGVALAFAAEGARVAINHPDVATAAEAEAVVAEITASGGTARAVQGDVSDPAQVDEMVSTVEAALGPVDILVSNAGIARAAPLHETAIEDFDRTIAVHLRGAFLNPAGTEALVPSMVLVPFLMFEGDMQAAGLDRLASSHHEYVCIDSAYWADSAWRWRRQSVALRSQLSPNGNS